MPKNTYFPNIDNWAGLGQPKATRFNNVDAGFTFPNDGQPSWNAIPPPSPREQMARFLIGETPPSEYKQRVVRGALGTTGIGAWPTGAGKSWNALDFTPPGWGLTAAEKIHAGDYQGATMAVVPVAGAPGGLGKALGEGASSGAEQVAKAMADTFGKKATSLAVGTASKEAAAVLAKGGTVAQAAKKGKVTLGLYPSTTAEEIVRNTKAHGGYTVNLATGEVPTSGVMAGKYANTNPRNMVVVGEMGPADAAKHASKNADQFAKDNNFFGTWFDKESKQTFLDVSRKFKAGDLRPATKFAEKTGQLSIYDIESGKTPPVANWRKFVTGWETPEGVVPFSKRVQEMNAYGEAYMAGHPNKIWWDTPNMDRVYKNVPREVRGGFIGATSTNTNPKTNMQAASEYIRRYLKNEPIIQPNFRVPDTAMGGFAGPGKTMGLEKGRAFNLQHAAAGNVKGYHGETVQEKVDALVGDPDASVLDRIHARLAEHPAAGLYTHSQKATVPSGNARSSPWRPELGPDRKLLSDAIAEQAKAYGKDNRTFSANVWTGIREWVKDKGELFGTDLRDVQRATKGVPSKSYDDFFMDHVRAKAAHLGISVKQMERLLSKGDAELLSYILVGTPFAGLLLGRTLMKPATEGNPAA